MTSRSTGPMALAALMLLAGCGQGANGDGVGGVTASEARALNQAAEMLDARAGAPAATAPDINPAAKAAKRAHGGRP